MLPVFSVIFEYPKDVRNSSARPTVRLQSLYCMYHLHSHHFKANPDMFIFIHLNHTTNQLQLITEQAFRRAQMLK